MTSGEDAAALDGRFTLLAQIGAGGMGTVYRAHDRLYGAEVAVKILERPLGSDELLRFEREAKILATLRHPAIVSYVAHGVSPAGHPYLAMERLDGEDLAARLSRGPLSPAQTLSLLRSAAQALACVHRHGIVHRDIKPSNLFLRDGELEQLVLLDFGVARDVMVSRAITRTGLLIGTPCYMSPEQARGVRHLGPMSDLFSLGCVAYECLTGRAPFQGDQLGVVLARLLCDEPPPLRARCPSISKGLERLVETLLAKEPGARPVDGAALDRMLAAIDDPVEPAPLSLDVTEPQGGDEVAALHLILAVHAEESPLEDAAQRLAALRAFGCRIESLPDGTFTLSLDRLSGGNPADQAGQAARCALHVRALLPGYRVALAVARGARGGRLSTALSQAEQLLDSGESTDDRVRITESTAALLDAGFMVSLAKGGVALLERERAPLDASRPLLGKPTPCVGREQELVMLEALVEASISDGNPCAAVVTADAGTGKSRLCHELLRRLQARHPELLLLLGRGDPMSTGSPYGMLKQVLRRLCGIVEEAGGNRAGSQAAEHQRAQLAERIGRHLPAAQAQRVIDFLGELCDVPAAHEQRPSLRAARQISELMAEGIEHAFCDFLHAETQHSPVLLVLEDLHWGDAASIRLCDAALRELPTQPLAVIALARDEVFERFPRLWEGRQRQHVKLGGLRRKPCEQLIRLALGDEVSAETVARITAQAAGNALFLEEIIRATAAGRSGEIPHTVLAVLQSRLSRLEPMARHVLRLASVFGETFWRGGVRALLGKDVPETALASWLSALCEVELVERLRESRFAGEIEYRFRHALMREAAYGLLDEAELAQHHLGAGLYLEAMGEREPLILAHHFHRGAELHAAGRYYARAAEQAHWGGSPRLAIDRAELALKCENPPEVRVSLLALIAEEYGWLGDFTAAGRRAVETLQLVAPGAPAWGKTFAPANAAAVLQGDLDASRHLIDALCRLQPAPDAIADTAFAMLTAAYMMTLAGERSTIAAIVKRQCEIVAESPNESLGQAWCALARANVALIGEAGPEATQRAALDGQALFQALNHRRGVLLCQIVIGAALSELGRYEEALKQLRGTLLPGLNYGPISLHQLDALLQSLIAVGSVDEAERIARNMIDHSEAPNDIDRLLCGVAQTTLGRVLFRQGQLAEAMAQTSAAIAALRFVPLFRLRAQALYAALLLDAGQVDAACKEAEATSALYTAKALYGSGRTLAQTIHAEALLALGETERGAALQAATMAELDARASTLSPDLRDTFLRAAPDHQRLLPKLFPNTVNQ